MKFVETKYVNECQIKMKWKIKKIDFLNIKDGFLQSEMYESNIPGVKYYLQMYPNGSRYRYGTIVYLCFNNEIAKKVIANYKIFVKSASSIKQYEENVKDGISAKKGKPYWDRDELLNAQKKFFVNDFMEIELEGTLKSMGGLQRNQTLSIAKLLWEEDDEKDITVIAENKEIKVHKCILSLCSPVFKAELNSGMKEAIEKKINITDFKFDTVKIAVEFLYERDIQEFINIENAFELLRFSDKYDIQPLHDIIQAFMIKKLDKSNVCEFANASVVSNSNDLKEFCVCFLMKFIGKDNTDIVGIKELEPEITSEIGRRCFLSALQ